MNRSRIPCVVALLSLLAAGLSGCATLNTWQRATLNSRIMEDPACPMEAAIEEHVHAIREAAQGATAAAGSSCGCN